MTTAYPSRVSFTTTQESLHGILDQFESDELKVPPHQRTYVWKRKQEILLVESVLEGTPMPPVLIRIDGRGTQATKSIEDGRQRLTCLSRYRKDEFEVFEKKFSQLSEFDKLLFNSYPMPVMTYKGATQEQTIKIFDKFQNGTPLSLGERYASLVEISPIIRLTKELLLTEEKGFHERAVNIWGKHSGFGKRGIDLVNAVALIAGLTFSDESSSCFSKKLDEMQPYLSKPISSLLETRVRFHLNLLMSIYEDVQKKVPLETSSEINFQWNLGNITGYIAWSLAAFPKDPERLKAGWVQYLCEVRTARANYKGCNGTAKIRAALFDKLHRDISQARFWEHKRWRAGYLRVFNPEQAKNELDEVSETGSTNSDESDE